MQAYSDPKRASDPHALPNIEVWFATDDDTKSWEEDGREREYTAGWYWWPCFPGCLPDGEPSGPFATEAEALANAQEGAQ